jgi:N-acetyl-beta-hexosaminidase
VFTCETGDWRFTEEFKTEPEAIAWIKKQLQGKKRAATPAATPPGGEVANGATVALATTTPDAVIHYTTDGSDPTETSTAYSAPIEITEETTIKAIATAEGFAASDVLEAHYTLTA